MQLYILSYKRFENTQWGKVEQMQPMWLCIFLCTSFEDTFENAQCRKVKLMQLMWLCIFLCTSFEKTFENTWWNATNVIMQLHAHHLRRHDKKVKLRWLMGDQRIVLMFLQLGQIYLEILYNLSFPFGLREDITTKKTFQFGHCPNLGRGLPLPEFFGHLFWPINSP